MKQNDFRNLLREKDKFKNIGKQNGLNLELLNQQKDLKQERNLDNFSSSLNDIDNTDRSSKLNELNTTKRKRNRDDILLELKKSKIDSLNDDNNLDSEVAKYIPPKHEALNSDDDIFNDVGDYNPPSDNDNSSSPSSSPHPSPHPSPRFSPPPSPLPDSVHSFSPSPTPELDDTGRLIGLSSSALPNISQRIEFDKQAEITESRKQRKQVWLAKQGIRKDTGEQQAPLPEKKQTDSQKLNSDYQRINAFLQKK
ncbi:hypothetical protein E3Q22_03862 [Wallemia mellicola]|uniref:Uncharacterized protein n=2 Tax=Wallemia mellicola TaxID=1708541 RepID=A0A4T0LG00_9BASI|nr:hypothetical protein WALSEDRAFT_58109 [Wallemia mellicola CBS 633.66]TIB68444.1 hypothetical protein E3Q24_03677 [Wallemia mellicola]EIM20643.1 hypothetical protein WALSEDRAFT_58109 [Wallemia mellicola CBS 633.66]TIB75756.1 hypothetical protein E3Q22_03862 [Wallemia mellicola]TIB96543.1 hypothetical protein E3Q17_03798 [Wallemia mellicola]TIC01003.1 hypothetical protein E3Q16_03867 [Wallemia mellicola]|eukprot:XP_006959426.1 hypothetical protein WALSEDRAFT_58109 [Wallemia mellicola CBS 633.66]